MDAVLSELAGGLPDPAQFVRVTLRLLIAALLGAALFVIGGLESGMDAEDLSRVVQGLATGIGFVGAGAILKLDDERKIRGLTTAAGIWLTAAVGVAAGLGRWGAAAIGVLLTWIIMAGLVELERRAQAKR
ncbi:MAG: MgtC/SapB family protein [Betaproteobacteria bacterium]